MAFTSLNMIFFNHFSRGLVMKIYKNFSAPYVKNTEKKGEKPRHSINMNNAHINMSNYLTARLPANITCYRLPEKLINNLRLSPAEEVKKSFAQKKSQRRESVVTRVPALHLHAHRCAGPDDRSSAYNWTSSYLLEGEKFVATLITLYVTQSKCFFFCRQIIAQIFNWFNSFFSLLFFFFSLKLLYREFIFYILLI